MEELSFFGMLREIIFWSSPAILLMGVVLLMYSNYSNFEKLMGREYGLRKRVLPKLETNIYSFHEWCLKKNTLIGLACIIYALIVFLILRKIPSLNEVTTEVF